MANSRRKFDVSDYDLSTPPQEFLAYDQINAALSRLLTSGWSEVVAQQIGSEYGPTVTAQVKAIYDAALDCPVDWSRASMDEALDFLHQFLDRQYPWLTPEARSTLNYRFIMTWK